MLSDSPTPPLGVPRVVAFESRTADAWRDHVPTLDQWIVAGACVFAAAALGFAVGRSSAPAAAVAMGADAKHAVCPDPAAHPSPTTPATTARDVVLEEGDLKPSLSPSELKPLVPVPETVAASPAVPDAAAQEATAKAIGRAMGRGARRATSCRGSSSPAGTAHVTVTFLPSGEVKTATVRGAPFAGTSEGECVAGKFRPLRVPPFTGDNVTVKKDLSLE